MFKSLRSQLLLWLLAPLALAAALDTWITFIRAEATATIIQERMLLGAARMIGEQVHLEEGAVQVVIPPAALELFASPSRDRVFYRVSMHDGQLLSGYYDFALPIKNLSPEEFVYFDLDQRGKRIHTVAFSQPVFADLAMGPITIQVGQTLDGRNALARDIWTGSLRSQLIVLPLLAFLLWLGMRRGLRPLMSLRNRMLERVPGALDKLDATLVPTEIEPIVTALNDYVARLDTNMSAHSRFIADASHQLRTPLTLLNTQIVFALRQADEKSRTEALHAMHESVQQNVRLVNQLLIFTLAQVGIEKQPIKSGVDLAALVKKAIESHASVAHARSIDLGFESTTPHVILADTSSLLYELVANLIDNALRYTPECGSVTIRICQIQSRTALQVEDTGPGIPPDQRDKVFERFYRLDDSRSDGCGLGLAIVKEISNACGAQIELTTPKNNKGLLVTVIFPESRL